jgi:phosphoribosylglycinamide formyltransferase-1
MLSLVNDITKKEYANTSLIISDNNKSIGLQKAKELGLKTLVLDKSKYRSFPREFDEHLNNILNKENIQLICLAGFMKILTPWFIELWENRILNIHPSILPKFKGLNTHERVIESGDRKHGCTVHYVNEEIDGGEILGQSFVVVLKKDNATTLAAKVLKKEHALYPKIVHKMIDKNKLFLTSNIKKILT